MSQLNTDSRSMNAARRRGLEYLAQCLPVDLLELLDGLRDDGLGRRARAGLGEHVDYHPAVDDGAMRAVHRGRPRRELPGLEDFLERLDARLDVPLGHLVEAVQVRREVHVTRGDPWPVLLRVHRPAHEILGRLRVLAVSEHAV